MKLAFLAAIAAGLAAFAPVTATAQDAAAPAPVVAAEAPAAPASDAAATAPAAVADAASTYTPMAPTKGKGMPSSYQDDPIKSLTFQDQYSADGEYAL